MFLRAGILVLPAVWCAHAYTPKGPRFSWDTLPVFFHGSNASGPVNSAGLQMMARFPLVTVEKFQGPCGWGPGASPTCDQEGQIIDVLRRVKDLNPNTSTVFYYNAGQRPSWPAFPVVGAQQQQQGLMTIGPNS